MIVFGFTLLLMGILLAIPGVPGPGVLVVGAGLAILAVEFVWARKLLKKVKDKGVRLKDLIIGQKNKSVKQAKPTTNLEPDPN